MTRPLHFKVPYNRPPMYCKECGQEFESKRKTAKYCSAKCRVNAARTPIALAPSALGVSVTEPVVSVTPDDELVTLTDTFHGHKISVIVPAAWSADKKASALVKAKIPFYPKPGADSIDLETGQERNKYANPADIW